MTTMLPLALLFLAAAGARQSAAPAARKSAPPPRKPAATVRLVKPKTSEIRLATAAPGSKPTPGAAAAAAKPAAAPEDVAAQAAVNQVIVDALNARMANKAQAQPAAASGKPAMTIDVPKRTPADAAAELQNFLKRTHKLGSKKNPVPEVKRAQQDMGGLTVDGIVGPKTRARAAALGHKLP